MRVLRTQKTPGSDPLTPESLCALLPRISAIVIVGRFDSSGIRDLIRHCHQQLIPALRIASVDELEPAWFADVDTVGLTAVPSTPEAAINAVHLALERMGKSHRRSSSHAAPVESSSHVRTTPT